MKIFFISNFLQKNKKHAHTTSGPSTCYNLEVPMKNSARQARVVAMMECKIVTKLQPLGGARASIFAGAGTGAAFANFGCRLFRLLSLRSIDRSVVVSDIWSAERTLHSEETQSVFAAC